MFIETWKQTFVYGMFLRRNFKTTKQKESNSASASKGNEISNSTNFVKDIEIKNMKKFKAYRH